jgi:hypothetical protein
MIDACIKTFPHSPWSCVDHSFLLGVHFIFWIVTPQLCYADNIAISLVMLYRCSAHLFTLLKYCHDYVYAPHTHNT